MHAVHLFLCDNWRKDVYGSAANRNLNFKEIILFLFNVEYYNKFE